MSRSRTRLNALAFPLAIVLTLASLVAPHLRLTPATEDADLVVARWEPLSAPPRPIQRPPTVPTRELRTEGLTAGHSTARSHGSPRRNAFDFWVVVTGRVLDESSLAPLSGSTIRLTALGCCGVIGRCEPLETTSTADGRFELRVPGPARYLPTISRDGYLDCATPPLVVAERRDHSLEPTLLVRGSRLRRTVWIAGTATPATDAGIELIPDRDLASYLHGGKLTAGAVRATLRSRVTRTDAEGRFELTGVSSGRYTLVVRAIGTPAREFTCELSNGGCTLPAALEIGRGSEILGTVLFRGDPLPSREVVLFDARERGVPLRDRTRNDGTFRFTGLRSGSLRLRVLPRHGNGESPVDWQVAVAHGGTMHLRLRLPDQRPFVFAGHVISRGQPLAKAKLLLFREPDAPSGPVLPPIETPIDEGEFEVELAVPGVYAYRIVWHDHGRAADCSGRLRCSPGGPPARITVPNSEIHARLIDGSSGRPIPGRGLALARIETDGRKTVVRDATDSSSTDEQGLAVFTNLPTGHYRVILPPSRETRELESDPIHVMSMSCRRSTTLRVFTRVVK